jgi:hypothetical protein
MEQSSLLDINQTELNYYINNVEMLFKNDKVLEGMENVKIISKLT